MKYFSFLIFYLFSSVAIADDKSDWVPRTFNCEDLKFEFTLGYYSDPSGNEIKNICECIDSKVSNKAKSININVRKGNAKFTKQDIQLLQNEFGNAIQSCAGKFIE